MTDEIKLSKAQRRALKAVSDNLVCRSYDNNGNLIRTPSGIGAAPVHVLERLRLIEESRDGIFHHHFKLTDAGRRWLWEHPE